MYVIYCDSDTLVTAKAREAFPTNLIIIKKNISNNTQLIDLLSHLSLRQVYVT